jgi:hypothetical protein
MQGRIRDPISSEVNRCAVDDVTSGISVSFDDPKKNSEGCKEFRMAFAAIRSRWLSSGIGGGGILTISLTSLFPCYIMFVQLAPGQTIIIQSV